MKLFDSLRSLRMTPKSSRGLHGQVVGVVAGNAELGDKVLGDLLGAQALRHQLDSALGSRCRGLLGTDGRLRLARGVYHEHDLAANAAGLLGTAANRSRSSAALPRATSSCSFVSSRQTATSRHGSTSAMTESAATSRFGLS